MPTDIESIIRDYYDKNLSKLRCLRILKTLINKIDIEDILKTIIAPYLLKKKQTLECENHFTMKIPDLDGFIGGL